jgi:hypothetical protein
MPAKWSLSFTFLSKLMEFLLLLLLLLLLSYIHLLSGQRLYDLKLSEIWGLTAVTIMIVVSWV